MQEVICNIVSFSARYFCL